jgi:hypothetical protein
MIEHVACWHPKGRSRTPERTAAAGGAHPLHSAAGSGAHTRASDRGAVEQAA